MTARVFGMVSVRASRDYTSAALQSFFRHTKLSPSDRFILIDNDASLDGRAEGYPQAEIVIPNASRSFAANLNACMAEAEKVEADLFFLNNDLYFFEGWIDPLMIPIPAILSPFTNRELHTDHPILENTMSLADLEGREVEFASLASALRKKRGLHPVVTLAYACVKLPYSVYSRVGRMDESFGRGGAEDGDYSLRAQLAGYTVAYVKGSFVLHFNGKSTWCGAETEEQSAERVGQYQRVFGEKWGQDLAALFLGYDTRVLDRYPEVMQLLKGGNYPGAMQLMVSSSKDV